MSATAVAVAIMSTDGTFFSPEVIAKLPPNRQNAASEGEERKRSVVTTLSLSDEAIAPRREGGWDESFAIASPAAKRHHALALVVAAGGSAIRFGSSKLLASLQGKPVFLHCLTALAPLVSETVLVTPVNQQALFQAHLHDAGLTDIKVVPGGASRVASVLAGLHALSHNLDFVAVQDAARPLTTRDVFERCAESARKYGSGVAAHRVVDTIKLADQQAVVVDTPDRSLLWAAETPQTFRLDWLRSALEQCLATGRLVTDDAHAVQLCGHPVHLVENNVPNPKITLPADLALAEFLLTQRLHV